MRKRHRANFETLLKEKMSGLRNRTKNKIREKLKNKENNKEKIFAKFYKMSYNELRQEAIKKNIKIWRKTKKELIELLIEQERLH
jgi:long-subunit acyl-CoA synthetase (AMP-forming)|tara:strand:- start:19 stop:273 length:255 start_codon:yes stop_codon:yes gene_type:complete